MEKRWIIIIGLVILLSLYILATNWIQTKELYPQEKSWFYLDISPYASNWSCLKLEPFYISYNVKLTSQQQKQLKVKTPDVIETEISLYKYPNCFGNVSGDISFSATNLSFPIEAENWSQFSINKTGNNSFSMAFNYSSEESGFKQISLYLPINHKFFNYYQFISSIPPSNPPGISEIDFNWNNGICGYQVAEDSLAIIEGDTKSQNPIFLDKVKRFTFSNTQLVLLSFSPISEGWYLVQKIMDALILGLATTGLYESIFSNRKKRLFKKKASKKTTAKKSSKKSGSKKKKRRNLANKITPQLSR